MPPLIGSSPQRDWALRIVFYVLGGIFVVVGLFTLIRQAPAGIETEPFPYVLLAVTGFVFLVIGSALGRNRPLLAVASVVAVAATSATVWSVVTEKPPPCADEITEAGSLAQIRPWLERIGYSQDDIESFQVTNITRFDDLWPTYAFYFTGTKKGKTQGALGVGNGCGIGELQETEPLTITKVD
jgi:hypothetical protein